jgi:hypothetical protein
LSSLFFENNPLSRHWCKTNSKTPRELFLISNEIGDVLCPDCNHYFRSCPSRINNTRWCPYCSNNKLCEDPNCLICFNKSFDVSPYTQFLDPNNRKTHRQVFLGSSKYYNFNCQCGHIISKRPNDIRKNFSCSYFSGLKMCDDDECNHCFSNSFSSHPMSEFWSINNKKSHRKVRINSDEEVEFLCPKSNHHFPSTPYRVKTGHWCSYCSHTRLCDNPLCEMWWQNSFASHPKAIFWAPDNRKTPREVFRSTSDKYDFICEACHRTTPFLFTVTQGFWCNKYKYKTQLKLLVHLITIYLEVEGQKTFDWCKNINHLPFDFYIPQFNLLIELDGPQHFRQVQNWDTPE